MNGEKKFSLFLKEKSLKDGSTVVIMTDNYGYVCGIYATMKDAKKALPSIEYNLNKGYVNRRMIETLVSRAESSRKRSRHMSVIK